MPQPGKEATWAGEAESFSILCVSFSQPRDSLFRQKLAETTKGRAVKPSFFRPTQPMAEHQPLTSQDKLMRLMADVHMACHECLPLGPEAHLGMGLHLGMAVNSQPWWPTIDMALKIPAAAEMSHQCTTQDGYEGPEILGCAGRSCHFYACFSRGKCGDTCHPQCRTI